MKKHLLLLLGILLPIQTPLAAVPPGYEFPIKDPYDATVIGTPQAYRAPLPEKIPSKVYTIDNNAEMPDTFWYNDGLKFSVALQDGPAPLVFNIAGTGAAYNSAKLVQMQLALYQAGFHVINISSPTYLNFLLSASSSHMPGYAPDDAKDIYRVMQQAYDRVKDDITVTEFHVAGYSLGAMHAVFVAKIDSTEKKFNLQKVFMINPPVNLYNSVVILDKLFQDNMPIVNGARNPGVFLDRVITDLGESYEPNKGMRLDGDFLYTVYKEKRTGDVFDDETTSAGLIGFSFRLTSSAMVFASDVMTQAGYIVPKGKTFTRSEHLGYYARASAAVTFEEYINDLLIPNLIAKYPNKTRADVIHETSLQSIENFMKNNTNIRITSNRDEIILAPGELAYLENLMGSRITVYPEGGHCGNMIDKFSINHMIAFLKGDSAQ
jgi:hypothetical protein